MKKTDFKFEINETVIYKGEQREIVSRWKFLDENYKGRGRRYKNGTRLYNVSGCGDIIPEQYLWKYGVH